MTDSGVGGDWLQQNKDPMTITLKVLRIMPITTLNIIALTLLFTVTIIECQNWKNLRGEVTEASDLPRIKQQKSWPPNPGYLITNPILSPAAMSH